LAVLGNDRRAKLPKPYSPRSIDAIGNSVRQAVIGQPMERLGDPGHDQPRAVSVVLFAAAATSVWIDTKEVSAGSAVAVPRR
jgi:hypothetical protein